ncbi:hypothetical protein AMTR_s00041p00228050 [Amborella trichopoda]|uniref:COBRA-like protein n=2 Tax=Amborella trichopoda TaxID=13333 RepID=W1PU16_AMBTC|nr:hypothetical protein AMTR_s00041p00228050 [Amborella trichopoda]
MSRPYLQILFFQELLLLLLLESCYIADCYDPLDPNGNITITYDIISWTTETDGYWAKVTIENYYQYRHVEKPGWKLGFDWAENEVIWSMTGALATQSGNCSAFKYRVPHCCQRSPEIIDLMPDAARINRSENCCRNGVLAARDIDPKNAISIFYMTVGNLPSLWTGKTPKNVTFMAPGPGYTCSPFADYSPTIFPSVGGRRETQAIRTWKSTCTYSQFIANKAPTCCVSLSSFYDSNVTPCPRCSCGCQAQERTSLSCIGDTKFRGSSLPVGEVEEGLVRCTSHMCPVRVHWHVKNNYMYHWRVKLTVTNYNYAANYSKWNIMVQHPGFSQATTAFSFNSTTLDTTTSPNEAALFWGLEYVNGELLQADNTGFGSVTSEILLHKDRKSFSLRNGWAFPRRVYFNGEDCIMPLPDVYPMLPNGSCGPLTSLQNHLVLLFMLLVLLHNFHLEQ